MTFEQIIQREYPRLPTGANLNIASGAVPPLCVQDTLSRYCAACFGAAPDGTQEFAELEAAAKPRFAALIGASADEIALTSSTAAGINVFAAGYPFAPGDNVILSQWEHPSCLFPFIHLHETKHVELRLLPKAIVEITDTDIEQLIDSRTRAVVLSAVQYATGYFADLAKIGVLCRARGILLVVDGMQALGRLSVDVERMHIDFLACGSKKGLLSVSGCGFLYCRRALTEVLCPPFVSLHSTPQRGNPGSVSQYDRLQFWNDARRFEFGTPNQPGLCCLAQSLALIQELGIRSIESHTLLLERAFREGLRDTSCSVIDFSSASRRSGIVVIRIPPEKTPSVREALAAADIRATLRDGTLRVSFSLYNSLDDVRLCVGVLSHCFPPAPGEHEAAL